MKTGKRRCRSCQSSDTRNRRHDNKDWINSLKEGRPCADCGGLFPPVCMDFDHLDASTKVMNIALMTRSVMSREAIQAEIDKCELVCANCHRLRTQSRGQTFQRRDE
jgi:hypothetical protein